MRGSPAECGGPTTTPRELALSQRAWMDLVRVNNWVNRVIKPLSDLGTGVRGGCWSYPDDGYGDCEDHVLLKRRMLIQVGWPRETLLVTVVRDEERRRPRCMTVITDEGDYVLDNQNKDILIWSDTGYRFIDVNRSPTLTCGCRSGDQSPATATATCANGALVIDHASTIEFNRSYLGIDEKFED